MSSTPLFVNVFRMGILVTLTPLCGLADPVCSVSGIAFTYSSKNLPVTVDVVEGTPQSAPGAECSIVKFSDIALAQPAFAAGLTDPSGALTDILTVGNSNSGQLILCQESEPFAGGNPGTDCPFNTITLIAGESGSVTIATSGAVTELMITGISFDSALPGQISDSVLIEAVPEPSPSWVVAMGSLVLLTFISRLQRRSARAL